MTTRREKGVTYEYQHLLNGETPFSRANLSGCVRRIFYGCRDTSDLVFKAGGKGKLKIVCPDTGGEDIICLDQFEGKQYDYNNIVACILHDYPNGLAVHFTRSAKQAIKKQAEKNQQAT